jgi:hypothetical protein
MFFVAVITFGLPLLSSQVATAGEFFFDTVLDKTISTSTPGKIVNLQGYKEFAVLARFEGPPNKPVYFEITYNQLTVVKETVQLSDKGWLNFAKTYPVYAPTVVITVINPPANLKAKITFYAGH